MPHIAETGQSMPPHSPYSEDGEIDLNDLINDRQSSGNVVESPNASASSFGRALPLSSHLPAGVRPARRSGRRNRTSTSSTNTSEEDDERSARRVDKSHLSVHFYESKQQDEAESSTSDSSSFSSPVSFTTSIPHHSHLDEDQRSEMWYSEKELKETHRACSDTVRAMQEGQPVDEEECASRGLEYMTPTGFAFFSVCLEAVQMVLEEQERQREENPGEPLDPELIAESILGISRHRSRIAFLAGKKDERVVQAEAMSEQGHRSWGTLSHQDMPLVSPRSSWAKSKVGADGDQDFLEQLNDEPGKRATSPGPLRRNNSTGTLAGRRLRRNRSGPRRPSRTSSSSSASASADNNKGRDTSMSAIPAKKRSSAPSKLYSPGLS